MDKLSVLRQYFGFSSFRGGQEELVDSLLGGRDVLGVMPTGAGKSVCYQVPALMLDGVTLVVSPLISLMKDQVSALVQQGVSAAYLNRSLTEAQYDRALRNAARGQYKIIYVAPERLNSVGFVRFAKRSKIALLAVDEAHCVSQWGQDFRPSYLNINTFLAQLPVRPVIGAFTATATEEVKRDIVSFLRLRDPVTVSTGFDRPNLFFSVLRPDNKSSKLLELIRERRDKSGIVYCSTRKKVEQVCEMLNAAGIAATRYHAGLDDEERIRNQDDFVFDRKSVMVAWNGDRQVQRRFCDPLQYAEEPRELLPGGGKSRQGRQRGGLYPSLRKAGCADLPLFYREQRAKRANDRGAVRSFPQKGGGAAAAYVILLHNGRLSARGNAALFRGYLRGAVRQVLQLSVGL